MSTPRRRIIRQATPIPTNGHRDRQVERLRNSLAHERQTLTRWQTRLRRAFNTVEKAQKRIARLEKQLNCLNG